MASNWHPLQLEMLSQNLFNFDDEKTDPKKNEVLSCCLGKNVNTCLHQDVVKENFLEEKNAFLTTKMSWLCCANFFPPPSIVHGLFFYAASMGMGVYCFGIMEVANNKIWESKFNKTGLHSCFDCQTPV